MLFDELNARWMLGGRTDNRAAHLHVAPRVPCQNVGAERRSGGLEKVRLASTDEQVSASFSGMP